jgi:hypothetical protein
MLLGALLAGAVASAQAPDLASARAFVERTYRAYCRDCAVRFDREALRLFTPRLMALVRRDRRLTPRGEVGALDGDPICDCQDFDIRDVRVEVRPAGGGGAHAVARFRNLGAAQTVRLDLVATAAGWRIDNIHSPGTPDLADYLRKHAGGR